ncbi:MAG TPA: nuclear transport factor 2 family protein [Thermoanaerobaculia bacterium]
MKRGLAIALAAVGLTLAASAQTTAPDAAELTARLHEFLAGASRNDPSAHEKFWADELIYTASAGRRIGKADILKDVRSAPASKPDDPKVVYTGEDIKILQYGDTAVVAFTLVGTTTRREGAQVDRYFNTGTFVKRGGRWQAVAWQATRIPKPDATPTPHP